MSALLALILLAGVVFAYRYFAANHAQIESIAVMPFVIESDNAEAEYLADGMTETLINSLSELPNVNVKARSSVFRYKGKETNAPTVGRELNVQAILTGSVMQRGEQLILNLELIDAQTENVIWSEQYNRQQADLINLQNEIARDVAGKVKIKLLGADEAKVTKNYTTSSEAFQLYLKGRFYWNKRTGDDLIKAIEQFKAAADKDSNFALAYVGLADSYALLQQYTGILPSETMPQAKAYAEHALQIDDSLVEAHTSMGFIHYNLWQWAEAEKEFKRAIELNPNYPTAHHWYYIYLRDMRRFDEALAEIKRAQELEPLSLVINLSLTRAYLLTGDLDSFIRETQRTMELYPNYASNYSYLGLAYVKQGRYADALAEMRKGVELERSSSSLAFLGYASGISGNHSEANAILKELQKKYDKQEAHGRDLAEVYAGLGKKHKAFEWLERDFQIRSGDLSSINWLPTFDSLRSERRFTDLLQRMGLEP